MKKFISTLQNLSARAAQLQAAVQSAPPKFAELREAVAMTAGQLQQLRSEVEQGITELKADDDEALTDSLREINSSVLVFQQAGYELAAVDMELSPLHQLVVHLDRMEDVSIRKLRSLLDSNQHRKFTCGLLGSLIRAEEMADQIDLENLVYYRLVANIGPIPSMRLCWRQENPPAATVEPASSVTTSLSASTQASTLKSFGEGSFFERRSTTMPKPEANKAAEAVTAKAEETVVENDVKEESVASQVTSSPAPAEPRSVKPLSVGKDWGASSLERFKKMPSVSKYRR